MKFYATGAERRRLRRQAADADTTVTAIVRAALGFGEPPPPRGQRARGVVAEKAEERASSLRTLA
jgi:hypothetical protein